MSLLDNLRIERTRLAACLKVVDATISIVMDIYGVRPVAPVAAEQPPAAPAPPAPAPEPPVQETNVDEVPPAQDAASAQEVPPPAPKGRAKKTAPAAPKKKAAPVVVGVGEISYPTAEARTGLTNKQLRNLKCNKQVTGGNGALNLESLNTWLKGKGKPIIVMDAPAAPKAAEPAPQESKAEPAPRPEPVRDANAFVPTDRTGDRFVTIQRAAQITNLTWEQVDYIKEKMKLAGDAGMVNLTQLAAYRAHPSYEVPKL